MLTDHGRAKMDVVPHTQIAKMAHDVKQLQNMMDAFDELYTTIFVVGTDFGPGRRGGKNVLLKPGAEKIFGLFNLTARTSMTEQECDHKQGFFSYRVVCEAFDRPSGGDGRRSYGGPATAGSSAWRAMATPSPCTTFASKWPRSGPS
tara:strand:+ start:461 stop:901 length:441 start_codon:yes stop_codon:yes gene_type:complete